MAMVSESLKSHVCVCLCEDSAESSSFGSTLKLNNINIFTRPYLSRPLRHKAFAQSRLMAEISKIYGFYDETKLLFVCKSKNFLHGHHEIQSTKSYRRFIQRTSFNILPCCTNKQFEHPLLLAIVSSKVSIYSLARDWELLWNLDGRVSRE